MKVSLDLDNEHLAEEYERVSLERQYRSGLRLIQELSIRAGENVLDIGAGTGLLAEHVADLVGQSGRVIGIDPLPLRIEIAERRARPNLSFRVGNAYDLGEFSEGQFDAVYMNAVFHWLPDKRKPLRQVFRILKERGRLGISTGAKGYANPLHAIRERVLSRAPYNQHPAALEPVAARVSVDELAGLLEEAGFQLTKLEARPNVSRELSADEAIQFSEASSFGNLLGHLPEKHRAQAREDIKHEFERDRAAARTPRRRLQLVAVATKP